MKTYIDFFETFKGEFLANHRFKNRFMRLWGTQTIDGIEVLKKRFTIYPGFKTDINIQRMLKLLGMTSQVNEANFNPIAGFYLWLNPDKDSTSLLELNKEILAEKVDTLCPQGEWKYSTINYIEKQDPSIFNGYTKEQLLAYIDNDYRRIFDRDNGFVVGDTLIESLMGKYVLFDDGTEFDVEVISSSITAVPTNIRVYGEDHEGGEYYISKQVRYTGLSIDIRYKRKVFDVDPEGLLVTTMFEEAEEAKFKELQQLIAGYNKYDESGGFVEQEPITNEVWYKGQLRVSAIQAKGIPARKLIEPIMKALDTGQIKKKVKWYKKILGFVLIVIVLIITWGQAWWVIGLALGVTTIVMTMIQASWAKDNAAAAGYMGRWVKVASILSTITNIMSIIENIAVKSATEAAKAGATEAAKEAAVQTAVKATLEKTFTEQLQMAASYLAKEVTTATTGSLIDAATAYIKDNLVSMAMRVTEVVLSLENSKRESQLQERNAYAQELADSNQAQIEDKNFHIGLEHYKWFADELRMSNSRYDQFAVYEPEAATMHIGNICRVNVMSGFSRNLRAEDLMRA